MRYFVIYCENYMDGVMFEKLDKKGDVERLILRVIDNKGSYSVIYGKELQVKILQAVTQVRICN
jgi:hypothetical protein